MEKKLKKWGNGLGIYFDTNDIETFGMKENDIVDLSDMFLKEVKIKKVGHTYKKLPTNDDNLELLKKIKKEVRK